MNIFTISFSVSLSSLILYMIYNSKNNKYIQKDKIKNYILIIIVTFSISYVYLNGKNDSTINLEQITDSLNNPKAPF